MPPALPRQSGDSHVWMASFEFMEENWAWRGDKYFALKVAVRPWMWPRIRLLVLLSVGDSRNRRTQTPLPLRSPVVSAAAATSDSQPR